ncbi:MAG: hypothetical protein M3Q42_10745 [Pseudomonadota bacterium]|nr:hypothetical protein [Pseudomonadota bacterium]
MNRHLHNTLSALSASAAVLVLGLIAAAPLMPHDSGSAALMLSAASASRSEAVRESTSHESTVAMIAIAIDQATTHDIDTAPPRRASTTQHRQALVMPYLSFVPRG